VRRRKLEERRWKNIYRRKRGCLGGLCAGEGSSHVIKVVSLPAYCAVAMRG
jgi:hypothetical protein